MVNLVAAEKKLLRGLMKCVGIVPHKIEIEPGTTMNIWVPKETIENPKTSSNKSKYSIVEDKITACEPTKPVVVLLHGFAGDGILTWQFQVSSLTKNYSVYVPDLLFFGGSITENPERSPKVQAEYLVYILKKLGIKKCTVVGFSYGGMVAFKMAELYPELVDALVISGAVPALTESISNSMLEELGFSSLPDFLLPDSVKGCRALFKVAIHKKLWIPDCLYSDFLEEAFNNRKERAELLEGLVVSNKDTIIPKFPQRIHLLWGENDQLFKLELVQNMKEQLGSKATFEGIKKAGHLVHLERPCAFNRCLKKFLDSLHAHDATQRTHML